MSESAGGPEKPRAYLLASSAHALQVIDAMRMERDWSGARLARSAGVDRMQILRWLAGRHDPGAARIWDLANALGYDVAFIPRANGDDEQRR